MIIVHLIKVADYYQMLSPKSRKINKVYIVQSNSKVELPKDITEYMRVVIGYAVNDKDELFLIMGGMYGWS